MTQIQQHPDRQPRRDRLPGNPHGQAQKATARVAVYSEADAGAPHVQTGGRSSVYIGPGPVGESYLLADTTFSMAAAKSSTGAQAIHPGYGFLSENAEFARGLRRLLALTFIGPIGTRLFTADGQQGRGQAPHDRSRVYPACPAMKGSNKTTTRC